jgi:hypothetical protein
MARDGAGRALAWTAGGALLVAAGAVAVRWAWPDRPALLAVPVAVGAAAFLWGVRRAVKPPRTGREEEPDARGGPRGAT